MMRMIGKETLVGMLNGIDFAVIVGIVTLLWIQTPLLAAVIAIAMEDQDIAEEAMRSYNLSILSLDDFLR